MEYLIPYPCHCPWCDAALEIQLDLSVGDQSYVEDCQVCCAPMVVDLHLDPATGDLGAVTLTREGD